MKNQRALKSRLLLRLAALAALIALFLVLGTSSVVAETVATESPRVAGRSSPAQTLLARKLERALAAAGIPASRRGAVVIDLETGETVFARNARRGLLPASNEKLPIAYVALTLLGPGYRIHTEALGDGERIGAEWDGDLVLKGYGDPNLSKAGLKTLARRVRATGIRSISGDLVGDESAFDRRRMAPGWKSSFFINECPPLSALSVDRGRDTSASPPIVAVRRFAEALRSVGVTVKGRLRLGRASEEATPLALINSPPLRKLLRFMNRESDNYSAELLLKQIGASENEWGSTVNGASLVADTLDDAGVPLGGVRIADGSGLSPLDRLTPAALGTLLAEAWNDSAIRWTFVSSLAIAGRNGTLAHRLSRPPALGNIRAKTGTTSLASALAGYVRDRYAFVILQNGSPVSAAQARVAQDHFVTLLAAQ
jgi:D-alanyl-D-alanine carboxypeptidase/D-alanyl-D-alanine-endopeptidase (penicillin-binding protein 4)